MGKIRQDTKTWKSNVFMMLEYEQFYCQKYLIYTDMTLTWMNAEQWQRRSKQCMTSYIQTNNNNTQTNNRVIAGGSRNSK